MRPATYTSDVRFSLYRSTGNERDAALLFPDRVVGFDVDTGPGFLLGPHLGGGGPEFVRCGKT